MGKEYYETYGSDYLNKSPTVQKESTSLVPDHNHDNLYYRKEQVDASQRDFDTQFGEIEQDFQTFRNALDNKSSTNHTHNNATTTTDGFMSAEDKRSLSRVAESKTNIFLTNATPQTFPANAATKLMFDTEITDALLEYDKPYDTTTVKKNGMYMISAAVEFNNAAATTGRAFLQVHKNGTLDSVFGMNSVLGSTIGGVAGTGMIHLVEGDTITVHLLPSIQVISRGKSYLKISKTW